MVVPPIVFALYGAFGAACAMALEVDRLWQKQGRRDAHQLLEGFTGKLCDAEASKASDKATILAEIAESGSKSEVEHAVHVLISAGMSTPSLRTAALSGANVQHAGRWSLGMVLMTILMFIVHPFVHAYMGISCQGALRFVPWLKVHEGIAWLVCFVMQGQDQRGLVAKAAGKLAVLPYLLCWSCSAALHYAGVFGPCCHSSGVHCLPDCVGAFVLGPTMLIVSVAGVARVAGMPVFGPALVQFLFACGENKEAAVVDDAVAEAKSVVDDAVAKAKAKAKSQDIEGFMSS